MPRVAAMTTTTITTTRATSTTTRKLKQFKKQTGSQRKVLKIIRRKQKTTSAPVTTTTVRTTPRTLRVKFRVASSRSGDGQHSQNSEPVHDSTESRALRKSTLNQQQLLNLQSFLAHQNKPKGKTFPNFPSA